MQQYHAIKDAHGPALLSLSKTGLVLLALVITCQPVLAADRDYSEGTQQHREGKWSAAFGRFTAAANRGDVAAARAALFMHRYGPLLYATQWDVSSDDYEDWHALVRSAAPPQPGAAQRLASGRTPAR